MGDPSDFKGHLDHVALIQQRYTQIHDDTFAPGSAKGVLRLVGVMKRAPLDAYLPELELMHLELQAIAVVWKLRLGELAAVCGDEAAAVGSYNSVVHLDRCVCWLHQIAKRYISGDPYPDDLAAEERLAYESARADAYAHAAAMDTMFRQIAQALRDQ